MPSLFLSGTPPALILVISTYGQEPYEQFVFLNSVDWGIVFSCVMLSILVAVLVFIVKGGR